MRLNDKKTNNTFSRAKRQLIFDNLIVIKLSWAELRSSFCCAKRERLSSCDVFGCARRRESGSGSITAQPLLRGSIAHSRRFSLLPLDKNPSFFLYFNPVLCAAKKNHESISSKGFDPFVSPRLRASLARYSSDGARINEFVNWEKIRFDLGESPSLKKQHCRRVYGYALISYLCSRRLLNDIAKQNVDVVRLCLVCVRCHRHGAQQRAHRLQTTNPSSRVLVRHQQQQQHDFQFLHKTKRFWWNRKKEIDIFLQKYEKKSSLRSKGFICYLLMMFGDQVALEEILSTFLIEWVSSSPSLNWGTSLMWNIESDGKLFYSSIKYFPILLRLFPTIFITSHRASRGSTTTGNELNNNSKYTIIESSVSSAGGKKSKESQVEFLPLLFWSWEMSLMEIWHENRVNCWVVVVRALRKSPSAGWSLETFQLHSSPFLLLAIERHTLEKGESSEKHEKFWGKFLDESSRIIADRSTATEVTKWKLSRAVYSHHLESPWFLYHLVSRRTIVFS